MDRSEELEIKESVAAERAETGKKSAVLSFLKELPFLILGAFIIAWVIKSFVVQPFKIEQQSMYPTLHPADRVFVNKFIYRFRDPEHGEIITFRAPDGSRILIKRVIATEGEYVEFRRGRVYIDKKVVKEPYLNATPDYTDAAAVKVPKNSVYVLGDNRPNSGDSRLFGGVPEKNILGKAFIVYWPVEHAQIVD